MSTVVPPARGTTSLANGFSPRARSFSAFARRAAISASSLDEPASDISDAPILGLLAQRQAARASARVSRFVFLTFAGFTAASEARDRIALVAARALLAF